MSKINIKQNLYKMDDDYLGIVNDFSFTNVNDDNRVI